MADLVRLASLKVAADFDASAYAVGAKVKSDADRSMVASGAAVSDSVSGTGKQAGTATGFYDTLRRSATGLGEAHQGASGKIKDFREMMRLSTDAVTGNLAGTARAGLMLTNAWGLLTGEAAVLSGGVALVAGAMTLAIMKADQMSAETKILSADLKTMGAAASGTASQLLDVVSALQKAGASRAEAFAITQAGTLSGNLSPAGTQSLGGLALDINAIRGGGAAADMQKLLDVVQKGYPAVVQLNQQWHFLTAAQLENIRTMAAHGDAIGVANTAVAALTKTFGGGAEATRTPLATAIHDVTIEWDKLLTSLGRDVGTPVLERLADVMQHPVNLATALSKILPGGSLALAGGAAVANAITGPKPSDADYAKIGAYGNNLGASPAIGITGASITSAGDTILRDMASDTAKLTDVTKAYLVSESAGIQADALRKAQADNLTTSVNQTARAYQNLLAATAATAQQGAIQTQQFERQATAARSVANVSGGGPAGVHAATLANQIDNATLSEHNALQALGSRTDQEATTIRAQLNSEIERTTTALRSQDESQRLTATSLTDAGLQRTLEERQTELGLMHQSASLRAQEVAAVQAKNQLMAEGWSQDLPGYDAELAKRRQLNQEIAKTDVGIAQIAKDQKQTIADIKEFGNFGLQAFQTMTAATGTWHDKLQTVAVDFGKVIEKVLILGPLERELDQLTGKLSASGGGGILGTLGQWLFGGGGGTTAATTADAAGAGIGTAFPTPSAFARGGVFSNGRLVRHYAMGDVFSSPTNFGMADGSVAQLGDAGPEGAIPLTRTAGGKLGVNASGLGGQTNHFYIDATNATPGVEDRIAAVIRMVKGVDASIERRAISSVIQARAMHPRAFQPRGLG